ncbi:hypothetical protein G3M55_39885 [Streptomyces sp. SID8455]|nr:hypothetical protein [Streptomyces sp. SID8455]
MPCLSSSPIGGRFTRRTAGECAVACLSPAPGVDDRELAAEAGALAAAGLPATAATTLGDLLTGAHPGRTDPATRSVYAPVGLPWQDLALSWLAHGQALKRGIGRRIDFLA